LKKRTVLIVDDERGIRLSFYTVLKDPYHVLLAETGREALDILEHNSVDLILLDILLPDDDGLNLLRKMKDLDPQIEVIMVTAVKEIKTAVKAIKLGAYEYIIKPFEVNEVLNIMSRALEKHDLKTENVYLRNELERVRPFEKIVGHHEKMQAVYDFVSTISEGDGAVLIQGESGTGKELMARAIHKSSPRQDAPFVVINCAAIPSTLMESEIFGHHKGSFTGATQTKLGKLELANKGTVFLDDIDTLDTKMQAKLLRVVQEKEFERLGSTKILRLDARFIAASNKNIPDLISKGLFREDLFYRLNVFPLKIPPLRDRKEDIPLLLDHFLELNAKATGKAVKRFSKPAIGSLMKYHWPGNVRELQNLVERSFTVTKKPVIHLKDISTFSISSKSSGTLPLKKAVSAFEKQYIGDVLDSVGGSRKKAAEILSIHRNTLLSKMNDLGLHMP
jgi:DNA-binding NtrC family response regulator